MYLGGVKRLCQKIPKSQVGESKIGVSRNTALDGLKIKLWIKNPCVKCQRVKSAHLGGLKKGGVKKYHTHLGIENDVAKNSPLG